MGLLPSANKAIGSGITAYIFLSNVKTIRDCYPFKAKITVCQMPQSKRRVRKTCDARNNIGE